MRLRKRKPAWLLLLPLLVPVGYLLLKLLRSPRAAGLAAPGAEVSCLAKVEQHVAAASQLNLRYRALLQLVSAATLGNAARALDELPPARRGPLHCVLAAVKDNIETSYSTWGLGTRAGNAGLASLLPPAKTSDAAIARLEAAGALVVGKANMDDLL
jgi:amidase